MDAAKAALVASISSLEPGQQFQVIFYNETPRTMTLRSALKSNSRGSARLEWMQTLGTALGGGKSNLRLHTQLFSGYGDSMIDYNRKRTVFTVGLSLVDF